MPSPLDITHPYVNPDTQALNAPGFNAMIAICRAVQGMRGVGGVRVSVGADGISIGLDPRRAGGATAIAGRWSWATVDAVNAHDLTCRLVDEAGEATGDPIVVQVLAIGPTGYTTEPTLTDMPWLAVGSYVPVEQRLGFRPGWWLLPVSHTTCL